MTGRFLLLVMAFVMTWSGVSDARAQAEFTARETDASLRDVVADPARGVVYAAAQDRDKVWVMDFGLDNPIATIGVGQSPVALALAHDGKTLACVNFLGNSLSLIDTATRSVRATVAVEDGPVAVAALPGGQFAVLNAFSDSLSVVDAAGVNPVVETISTVGVPGSLAVGAGMVAVGGRVPPSVQIHALPSWKVTRTIVLPEPPVSLAWWEARLAVATGRQVRLYGRDGALLHTRDLAVGDLRVMDGQLYALTDSAILSLDNRLVTLDEWPLHGAAKQLRGGGGLVAALAPGKRRVYVRADKKTVAPGLLSPERAGLTVTEAVDAAVVPPMPSSPPVEPSPPEKSPPKVPAPAEAVASPPETPRAPHTAATSGGMPEGKSRAGYRKHPLMKQGIRAPSPQRPSASPLRGLSKRSIADAIIRPSAFLSSESGFQPPDLNERGNLQADNVRVHEGEYRAEGHVRLRLGDMYATMDRLDQWEDSGVIHGEGHVLLEQGASTLRAKAFTYYPAEETTEIARVFESALLDDTGKGKLQTGGKLEALGVELREPTRELSANRIDYDFSTGCGSIIHARGRAGIYFFSAEELRLLGPKSMEGKDVWVSTCDHDPPHYKLRLSQASVIDGDIQGGTNARLQLWNLNTPFWLPKWRRGTMGITPWNITFDNGRRARIGYYVNVGQQFAISPSVELGPRLFFTENEGVGLGADLNYDFMNRPAAWLFRSKGEAHGFQTTEGRGYLHIYHRYEYNNDLVVRAQLEQWSDEDFYKDFFFDKYTRRTAPRTFVNATYRRDAYVATATVRPNTHHWVSETERLPETTFHLLERPLVDHLLVSFDTVNGYNSREPHGSNGTRTSNVLRLTYDWDPLPALAITPFWEIEGTWYSRDRQSGNPTGRLTTTLGTTAQTRFHKTYGGFWGFSTFKHLVVPSVTYSYRPNTSIDPYETPRYDALDNVYGHSRIELKLDNVFYGRDADTKEVWQVARITLYQGNDFSSEYINSEDYEAEFDLRPRSWWGMQVTGERHTATNESESIRERPYQRRLFDWYERVFDRAPPRAQDFELNNVFGDYNRILANLYYDNTTIGGNINGRIGYAYTETRDRVYNREILYGLGRKLGEHWGVGFEHIYDFERNELRQQTYELRRSLHCWEMSLRFRDRKSGFDVNVAFNIKAFPGSKLKF